MRKTDILFYAICLAFGILNFWFNPPFWVTIGQVVVAVVISVLFKKYLPKDA